MMGLLQGLYGPTNNQPIHSGQPLQDLPGAAPQGFDYNAFFANLENSLNEFYQQQLGSQNQPMAQMQPPQMPLQPPMNYGGMYGHRFPQPQGLLQMNNAFGASNLSGRM